jgi:molybdopterin/thiamine biosynthesis adenylyltransferase
MDNRYSKNKKMISQQEQEMLKNSRVCVVGCGGLGGYVLELLARLGVGQLTAVDGDRFDQTNLNRQLLSLESNLGEYKAVAAKKRIEDVNSEIDVDIIIEFLNEENAEEILLGHDLIIDALDSINTRRIVQEKAKALSIPFIHGAIAGWYGQVCTIMPGDDSLDYLYKSDVNHGEEKKLGNPSYTPALVASIEVSEATKVLLDKGELIRNEVLYVDLLEGEFHKLPLKK